MNRNAAVKGITTALELFPETSRPKDNPKMSNVYTLPQRGGNRPPQASATTKAFDDMTDAIILARAAAGTLDPAIIAALLAAVREPACGAAR